MYPESVDTGDCRQ